MASLANHIRCGFRRSRLGLAAAVAQVADNVLHHNHCSVHHHPEIKGTQRQQICGNTSQIEPYGSEEQGERNGKGDDEGGARAEQKQKQDHGDQNHAFRQIVHHGVQSEAKEIAAVQHGHHCHAGGQDTVVELFHLVVDRLERSLLFSAFSHQDGSLDNIRLVNDVAILHVVRSGHVAQTDLGTLDYIRDVPHPQRSSGLCGEHGLLNVMHRIEKPERAHVHLLHANFDEAAARVDVVVGKLLFHLPNAQSIRHQLGRVHAHLVLPYGAAEVGHIDHVRNGFELLQENPVFERS